jgi:tRNA pseudouridine65 synthase
MTGITVLWQDEDLIAVVKPPGLATVAGEGLPMNETLMHAVRKISGQWVYPVHRLDRATSGIVVFARSAEAARLIAQDFEKRVVHKEYVAIVRGIVKSPLKITRPLQRLDRDEFQDATTEVMPEIVWTMPWPAGPIDHACYSFVRLSPLTGRTHQLRRHLNGIARPIIGDTKYGDGKHNRMLREKLGIYRLLLHAERLTFPHPRGRESLVLCAPFSDVAPSVLDQIRHHAIQEMKLPNDF